MSGAKNVVTHTNYVLARLKTVRNAIAGYIGPRKKTDRDVVPWSEVKSNRGRKKTVDSSGYACLNLVCQYFGVTDARIYALVSEGKRGKNKYIQYFRCQKCGKRRTSRLGTGLFDQFTQSQGYFAS